MDPISNLKRNLRSQKGSRKIARGYEKQKTLTESRGNDSIGNYSSSDGETDNENIDSNQIEVVSRIIILLQDLICVLKKSAEEKKKMMKRNVKPSSMRKSLASKDIVLEGSIQGWINSKSRLGFKKTSIAQHTKQYNGQNMEQAPCYDNLKSKSGIKPKNILFEPPHSVTSEPGKINQIVLNEMPSRSSTGAETGTRVNGSVPPAEQKEIENALDEEKELIVKQVVDLFMLLYASPDELLILQDDLKSKKMDDLKEQVKEKEIASSPSPRNENILEFSHLSHQQVFNNVGGKLDMTGESESLAEFRVRGPLTGDLCRSLDIVPSLSTDNSHSEPSNSKQHNMGLTDKRNPYSNIRHEFDDKMSRLEGTNISYMEGGIIGGGATSIVYKGRYGSKPAAIKRIKADYINVYENELKIWQEMKQQSEEGNVNIVELFSWKEFPEMTGIFYYFAMELATGNLRQRIEYLGKLKTDETVEKMKELKTKQKKLRGFIRDTAKGLDWIHNSQILHRDIKPENVLLFKQRTGREIAKLADFGISRKLSGMSTGTNSMGIGTTDWMSPEAIEAMNFDKKFKSTKAIDIFSLGMTAHFALSLGTHPFGWSKKYGKSIANNILGKKIPPAILGFPHFAADNLIQSMMQKMGDDRPKIMSVLNHTYFWSNKMCLEFLLNVAICFDSKDEPGLSEIRDYVNKIYQSTFFLPLKTNWVARMGKDAVDLFSKIKSSDKKKSYEGKGNFVLMLVKLIRDKYVHCKDLPDELAISDK